MEACRGAGHPVLTVELHRAVQFTGLLQGSSGLGYAEPEEDGCARPRSHEVRRVLPGVRREPEEDGCARPRSLLLVLLGRERSERPEDPRHRSRVGARGQVAQFTALLQGSSGLGYAEPEEDGCAGLRRTGVPA